MANRVRSTALIGGVAVAAVLLLMVQRSQAQTVASDRAAGYVVFPKILVDASDLFTQGRRVDTVVQLTNTAQPSGTDNGCRLVQCAYVNATMHCSNAPTQACRSNGDCPSGGTCGLASDWSEDNFTIILSSGQAAGWSANEGTDLPPDATCNVTNPQPIPGVVEPFFVGELKCVEAQSANGPPQNANDLTGEATIYEVNKGAAGGVDVRSYSAIGIQSLLSDKSFQSKRCVGGTAQGASCPPSTCPGGGSCESVLCLGQNPAAGSLCPQATYAGCPSLLILNHFFDGAENPINSNPIRTDLTLAPCSEDLRIASVTGTPATVVQLLVFNEYEQRFSASTSVRCLKETQLSHIDTLPGNELASIFNINVQGTLTGQTRIRPIPGTELNVAHGLLGIAEEFSGGVGAPFPRGSSAYDLDYVGSNPGKADAVILHSVP